MHFLGQKWEQKSSYHLSTPGFLLRGIPSEIPINSQHCPTDHLLCVCTMTSLNVHNQYLVVVDTTGSLIQLSEFVTIDLFSCDAEPLQKRDITVTQLET